MRRSEPTTSQRRGAPAGGKLRAAAHTAVRDVKVTSVCAAHPRLEQLRRRLEDRLEPPPTPAAQARQRRMLALFEQQPSPVLRRSALRPRLLELDFDSRMVVEAPIAGRGRTLSAYPLKNRPHRLVFELIPEGKTAAEARYSLPVTFE